MAVMTLFFCTRGNSTFGLLFRPRSRAQSDSARKSHAFLGNLLYKWGTTWLLGRGNQMTYLGADIGQGYTLRQTSLAVQSPPMSIILK